MKRTSGHRVGRYVLESLLGRGGMGEVWSALDPKLDRRIALKILPRAPSTAGDAAEDRWAKARARMLREARAVASLSHPNIVAVFDVGELEDAPYLAMELVDGVTLREYIGDTKVPLRRRAQWLSEIARALAAAHARGIVHRDVKPENVMVRQDGMLKVLDFGIARRVHLDASGGDSAAASRVTREGELVGTLLYMAPEQFDGGPVDARADQFAWGVLGLELLRGEHPWAPSVAVDQARPSSIAIMEAILGSAPPVIEPSPDLPDELPAAIARALAKRPVDRFPSMATLLDALGDPERPLGLRPGREIAPQTRSTLGPVTLDDSSRMTLTLGITLAGRFELVRLVARGGMGDVYEAIDRTDGARVAIKTVRADRARELGALARFRREIDLAKRVVHPNVARVIDAYAHETPSEPAPMLLLAMELVPGETLAEHLRRRGPLPTGEALPLVRQMAAALGAAHAAGVVHRDFKASNILLAPSAAGGGQRVVVTDFGVARALESDDGGAGWLSRDFAVVGTPAYMAPEQVAGEPVDARADIYALGVVLFEMVTGRLPFAAEGLHQGAMTRLHVAAPSPRIVVPDLDEAWERTVLRCLARDPEERFASAGDVVAALERRPKALANGSRTTWTRSRTIGAAAVMAVALAAVGAGVRSRPSTASPGSLSTGTAAPAKPADGKVRTVLSVLPPANLAGRADVQWVGSALGEVIGTELGAGEELRVVPGERVAQGSRDLALDSTTSFTPETLARLRANLGTDYVVAGSYVVVGDGTVRADLTLQDARTGATIKRVGGQGRRPRCPILAVSLGRSLRGALGLHDLTEAQETTARAAVAKNRAVLAAFSEGQARFRSADYLGARDAFERAIAADPSYPLAHAALSQTLWSLSEEPRSVAEAKIAFASSQGLAREEQLVIEGRYRTAAKEYDRAAQIYRALFEFFPDNTDYGTRYAAALDNGGKTKEALLVLGELRKLPPPDGDDPRLDNLESMMQDHLGDQKRSLAAALAAVPKAEARGQKRTLADAHRYVGESLWGLDRIDEGLPELERARVLYEEIGDKGNLSTTLDEVAGIMAQRGAPAKALPLMDHALDLARQVGDRFRIAHRLRRLADTHDDMGDVAGARALWEEALRLENDIKDERNAARLVGRLGTDLRWQGDTKGARARFADSLEREKAVHFKTDIMQAETYLSDLALATGDVDEAERQAKAVSVLAEEVDDKLSGADAELLFAAIAREKGDSAASRKAAEGARALYEKAQGALGLERTRLLLAGLALDDRRAGEAEALARAAAYALHEGGYRGYEAVALATLAEILVVERKTDEAAKVVDRAEALAPARVEDQLDVAMARARVLLASPDTASRARPVLEELRARAEKAGLLPRERAARSELRRAL